MAVSEADWSEQKAEVAKLREMIKQLQLAVGSAEMNEAGGTDVNATDNPLSSTAEDLARSTEAGAPAMHNDAVTATASIDVRPGGLDAAVKRSVALVPAPLSLHQVAAAVCFAEDDGAQPPVNSEKYLWLSFAVVVVQFIAVIGVQEAVFSNSCASSVDCQAGWFCYSTFSGGRKCDPCMTDHFTGTVEEARLRPRSTSNLAGSFPGPSSLDTTARQFCAFDNLTAYQVEGCEACFDPLLPSDDWNIGRTFVGTAATAVEKMRPGDWVVLFLVSVIVGLYVGSEIQDTLLVMLLVQQRTMLSPRPRKQRAFLVLACTRQYCLVAAMVATVPTMVFFRGSDALQMCFNVVAILILLEIDNKLCEHWIPGPLRAYVVEHGLPQIGLPESRFVSKTAQIYTCIVVVIVVGSVALKNPIVAMAASHATVWLGGICNITFRVDTTKSTFEAVKIWMQELRVALMCYVVVRATASIVVNQ